MHTSQKISALGSICLLSLGVPPYSRTWAASDCSPAYIGVKLEYERALLPISATTTGK